MTHQTYMTQAQRQAKRKKDAERARRWREANPERQRAADVQGRERPEPGEHEPASACSGRCKHWRNCLELTERILRYSAENDPDFAQRVKPLPCMAKGKHDR